MRTAASSSPQISTSESIGSPRWPASLAGRWWNTATTRRARHGRLHGAATEPHGRHQRLELVADTNDTLAMLTRPTLPASSSSFSYTVVAAQSHGVAMITRSQAQAAALSPLSSRAARSASATTAVARLHRPVLGPRADHDVVTDRGKAGHEGTARRTGATQCRSASIAAPTARDPSTRSTAVGLLDGKNIVITGVLTDASLAATAWLRWPSTTNIVLTGAGRALSLTQRGAQAPRAGRGPRARRHRARAPRDGP